MELNINFLLTATVCVHTYYGDCIVFCDDYVALKFWSIDHPCMFLYSCHCRKGHLEVVKFLLINSKPDVNSKDKSKRTPLLLACS